MASDESSLTNQPTFHRGLEEFIPWALGHLSVGVYREGESEFFLQLTHFGDHYFVWSRQSILSQEYELQNLGHSDARSRLDGPLGQFSTVQARHWAEQDRVLVPTKWKVGSLYPHNISRGLRNAWIPGVRLLEDVELTAGYIQQHGEGRVGRIAIERYGIERYLHDLGARKIDETTDALLFTPMQEVWSDDTISANYHAEVGGVFIRIEKLYQPGGNGMLVVTDATSGERVLLRVPSGLSTVAAAKAWTFGLSPEEYVPAIET